MSNIYTDSAMRFNCLKCNKTIIGGNFGLCSDCFYKKRIDLIIKLLDNKPELLDKDDIQYILDILHLHVRNWESAENEAEIEKAKKDYYAKHK